MRKGFDSILLWALGISALALVGMFVAVFIIYFSGPSASSQHLQYFGQVGDFFGGMLNPILAFASFIALLYTIRIQSEELRLTREEFAKSVEAQSALAFEAKAQVKKDMFVRMFMAQSESLREKVKALQVTFQQKQFYDSNDKQRSMSLHDVLLNLKNYKPPIRKDTAAAFFKASVEETAKNLNIYRPIMVANQVLHVIESRLIPDFENYWTDLAALIEFSEHLEIDNLLQFFVSSISKDVGVILGFIYLSGSKLRNYSFLCIEDNMYQPIVGHAKLTIISAGGQQLVDEVLAIPEQRV